MATATPTAFPSDWAEALAEKGFFLADEFLPPGQTEAIRHHTQQLIADKALKAAAIGTNTAQTIDPNIRRDAIL